MIRAALDDALCSVTVTPADAATVALARSYADAIDGGDLKHGPSLLAALVQLGMTPRARAAVTGGVPDDDRPSTLDELNARRAARRNAAASMD